MTPEVDLLTGAHWELCAVAGTIEHPKLLDDEPGLCWLPAAVPGTAASALRDAGVLPAADVDSSEWWWRTVVTAGDHEAYRLELDGVATLHDVWVAGEHVHSGSSMFLAASVPVAIPAGASVPIAIRCRALRPELDALRVRAPGGARARWRTALTDRPGLRHVRTTLLGRMPGQVGPGHSTPPVGPYRPVRLVPPPPAELDHCTATVDGSDGVIRGDVLAAAGTRVTVGAADTTVQVTAGDSGRARFELRLPDVELWWPHGYGDQARYPLTAEVDGSTVHLRTVAFRTVTVDEPDAGFALRVNGVPVFARGAVWTPLDPVGLADDDSALRAAIAQARDGNATMLRVPGTAVYETPAFYDLCDEFGLLVWQDCMLANLDPSDDPAVRAQLRDEVDQFCRQVSGLACVAVVSGGSEIEQQAAMSGVDRERWSIDTLTELLEPVVTTRLPGAVYASSSPSGGALPFSVDTGIAHYFGVGAYLRPLEDARRSGVRFAAECLAFAAPPESGSLLDAFGSTIPIHEPSWTAGVPRDAGAEWDFEDVRDHYVHSIFGVDPVAVRAEDPARYLDLGRAAVAECVEWTFREWRRAGSACAGGLVLTQRDTGPGAGWGLVDVTGTPKSSWYAARRAWQPVTVLATDEGLNGLRLHVVNDAPTPLRARLSVTLCAGIHAIETVTAEVEVAAHGAHPIDTAAMLPGFRDLTAAFGFGPNAYSAVAVDLHDDSGTLRGRLVHCPVRRAVDADPDLGLAALASRVAGGWVVDVRADRAAHWVCLDLAGRRELSDNWFHLAPGLPYRVRVSGDEPPTGTVRALNAPEPVEVRR